MAEKNIIKENAILAAKTLDAKKANDILILDISEKSGFGDYFVIATASSMRQLISLADELDDKLYQQGLLVKNIEGKGQSGWILLDYGDIIINLFTEEARSKYQLEKIWGDCAPVEYMEG